MAERSTRLISYPVCGDWACDDTDYDWETAAPGDPEYRGAKREEQLAMYHQPRRQWRERIQRERDEKNHGWPLWVDGARMVSRGTVTEPGQ